MTKSLTRTMGTAILACLALVSGGRIASATESTSAATPEGPGRALRGTRYCEVLVGNARRFRVTLDVYTTAGLGDCPRADWARLDAAQLEREVGADRVVLNGPRYWTLDRIEGSKLVDPTPRSFGALPMRKAAKVEMSMSEARSQHKPYVGRDVQRTTVFVFEAGKPVRELVDPSGRAFVMQSYSVQKVPQTEESLATLGGRLKLPEGWTYRTSVPTADLRLTASGVTHVVQDDLGNTYQMRQ